MGRRVREGTCNGDVGGSAGAKRREELKRAWR